MKKVIATLATATALIVSGAVSDASHAEPMNGTVQRYEFRDVSKGDVRSRVEDHFDTYGKFQYQGGGYLSRTYRGWTRKIIVSVTYKRIDDEWRLDYKSAYRKSGCNDC